MIPIVLLLVFQVFNEVHIELCRWVVFCLSIATWIGPHAPRNFFWRIINTVECFCLGTISMIAVYQKFVVLKTDPQFRSLASRAKMLVLNFREAFMRPTVWPRQNF